MLLPPSTMPHAPHSMPFTSGKVAHVHEKLNRWPAKMSLCAMNIRPERKAPTTLVQSNPQTTHPISRVRMYKHSKKKILLYLSFRVYLLFNSTYEVTYFLPVTGLLPNP